MILQRTGSCPGARASGLPPFPPSSFPLLFASFFLLPRHEMVRHIKVRRLGARASLIGTFSPFSFSLSSSPSPSRRRGQAVGQPLSPSFLGREMSAKCSAARRSPRTSGRTPLPFFLPPSLFFLEEERMVKEKDGEAQVSGVDSFLPYSFPSIFLFV